MGLLTIAYSISSQLFGAETHVQLSLDRVERHISSTPNAVSTHLFGKRENLGTLGTPANPARGEPLDPLSLSGLLIPH